MLDFEIIKAVAILNLKANTTLAIVNSSMIMIANSHLKEHNAAKVKTEVDRQMDKLEKDIADIQHLKMWD